MDSALVDLARSAGTAVVALMATDAWERTRDGAVALWRRGNPARADGVADELDATRDDLLAARQTGDDQTEDELREEWTGRVRRLLREEPAVADELRHLLAELEPLLPEAQVVAPTQTHMTAEATGNGRVYQAGRDQHITER